MKNDRPFEQNKNQPQFLLFKKKKKNFFHIRN